MLMKAQLLRFRIAVPLMLGIAGPAIAQPNVFLMVDFVQQGGPSAVQSSVGYSRNKGASYSDTSQSAQSTKAKSASSEKSASGYSYSSSAAAAASNGRSSAAARASARGAGGSSQRSASASSSTSASVSKANVQYEQHDNVSYGQTVYAQTGGDNGLPPGEALSMLASSLLQYPVDVTYPEMLLAEFFNGNQPSIDVVLKSSKYGEILKNLSSQEVDYVMTAKFAVRGTGGTVSNYGCQGSVNVSLSKTTSGTGGKIFAVASSARGQNLEDCQRVLTTQLSDAIAEKVIPALGN